MALPPRFPMMPGYGGMTMLSMPFTPQYFMPTNLVSSGARLMTPQQQYPIRQQFVEKLPVTTVFVGNIHERCSNDLIRSMLQECGNIVTWKRIQGSNGKFQAFGFCEYDHPESTMRALRLLHDMTLGDKKLVVKVDEKTRDLVREFVTKKMQNEGKSLQVGPNDMPEDGDSERNDAAYRKAIITLIEQEAPDLLPSEDGEITSRSPTLLGKGGNLDVANLDRDKKEYIRDEIERFRQTHKEDEQSQKIAASKSRTTNRVGRSPSDHSHRSGPSRQSDTRKRSRSRSPTTESKRSKRAERSVSASSSDGDEAGGDRSAGSSSDDSASSIGSSTKRRNRDAFKSNSASRDVESEDSNDAHDRRMLQKLQREKDTAYKNRLSKWESRERQKSRQYEKDEQKEKQRKREEQKEAKKLKEFLEDYDDERDDLKYYKSSSLFQRRREYEREREMDAKDKQREQQEIEELKRQVLAEGKIENADEEALKRHRAQEEALLRKMRADSGSPSPHCPLGQKPVPGPKNGVVDDSEDSSSDSASDNANNINGSGEKKKNKKKSGVTGKMMKVDGWIAVSAESSKLTHNEGTPMTPNSMASPSTSLLGHVNSSSSLKPGGKLSGIFGEDVDFVEDEESAFRKQKVKLKPFEITQEDRIQAMTPEERKKLIKDLIEKIPTSKEELFDYAINWDYVDEQLVERRVKPWVTKKIVEYIGEDEPTLVEFICQKVNTQTPPKSILDDISMVLDDEAEVFVVKMWRLLIYESEAKKLGIVKLN